MNIYNKLTIGQQALFMFNAYYNHAKNSLSEFAWWSTYYFAQPKVWAEIKKGLLYFKVDVMMKLFDRLEALLNEKIHPRRIDCFEATYKDFKQDAELQEAFKVLYSIFHEISPIVLATIGDYIRNNSNEFIQFVD